MTPADDASADPDSAANATAPADEPGEPEASTEADAELEAPEATDQDDLKAKYREALAHKHGSHGASTTGHGERSNAPHGANTGPGHRMFRRKSG